ncbi:hypothetical protein DBA29_27105 [Xenophilus aerolatus]|nr:hypothetical protein [Xenophilus aerolatus]
MLRARAAMTRRQLAVRAGVSERHLASLESGVGNPSVVVLHNVAQALGCSLVELIGDFSTETPEWMLLRQVLARLDERALGRVRQAIERMLRIGSDQGEGPLRRTRMALVGLRGAGKSTVGRLLAKALELLRVELSAEIEKVSDCGVVEIQSL